MNKGKVIFWTITGLVAVSGIAYGIMYFNKPKQAPSAPGEPDSQSGKSSGSSEPAPRTNPYQASGSSKSSGEAGGPPYGGEYTKLDQLFADLLKLGLPARKTESTVNVIFGLNGRSEYVIYIYDNNRYIVKGVYSKKEVDRGTYKNGSFSSDSVLKSFTNYGKTAKQRLENMAGAYIKKGLI